MTHVFTLQLSGERRWLVEREVLLEQTLAAARDPSFCREKESTFAGPAVEFVLRPGDAFYVPACCVHGVTGVSWSLSLSLGLRAFNEVDFVVRLLENFERAKCLDYAPLDSLPESVGERHVQAKINLLRRVRALLEQLEGAAKDAAMTPLHLPETLSPLTSKNRGVANLS
jgi:ribosomal protein L16 Arg81 hydroxylase